MSTPDPYKPCPCGSEKKYKFCCRPAGKFKREDALQTEPLEEAEELDEPSMGIADAFGVYARPLVERAGPSKEDFEKALTLALVCWNIAAAPEDIAADLLKDLRSSMHISDEEFEEFRECIVEPMIERARQMFPRRTPVLHNFDE